MTARVPAHDGRKDANNNLLLVLPDGSTLLNGYSVIYMGAGGMSISYKGVMGKESYFIKEVESSDSRQVVALSQEKATLERLDHPGIIKIFDFFEQDGFYYLVMKFIEGESLEKFIPQNPDEFLPEDEASAWMWQLYEIFEYLHSQNPPIIYRDLKPQNVIRDKKGRIHLVDFGIARVYKDFKKADTESMGTMLTASPEQYGGMQTDERSDIYTIGATFHYLLTKGLNTRSRGIFDFPPIRSINPALSENLERVIQKSLEVEPEKRFHSIREMREAHLNSNQPRIDNVYRVASGGATSRLPSGRATFNVSHVIIVIACVLIITIGISLLNGANHAGPEQIAASIAVSEETNVPDKSHLSTDNGSSSTKNHTAPDSDESAASPTPPPYNTDGGKIAQAPTPAVTSDNEAAPGHKQPPPVPGYDYPSSSIDKKQHTERIRAKEKKYDVPEIKEDLSASLPENNAVSLKVREDFLVTIPPGYVRIRKEESRDSIELVYAKDEGSRYRQLILGSNYLDGPCSIEDVRDLVCENFSKIKEIRNVEPLIRSEDELELSYDWHIPKYDTILKTKEIIHLSHDRKKTYRQVASQSSGAFSSQIEEELSQFLDSFEEKQ